MKVQETLLDYITTQLLNSNGAVDLAADDNLLLSGLIDSHGVMRLVKFTEDSFSIKINPGDITLKNFKTVSAIAAFVDKKTAVTS
jgi:acyl carrier protein